MSRVRKLLLGGLLLLAGLLLIAVRRVTLSLSPLWLAVGFAALVGGVVVLWLTLSTRPTVLHRLPRFFWLGLALVLLGLIAAQPWFVVTTWRTPIRIEVGQFGSDVPPQSMQRATLPASLASALHLAFPRLELGEVWQVEGSLPATYEIWLRRPKSRGFALQVEAFGGELQIENQQENNLYTGSRGKEVPLRHLTAMFRPGPGVHGPYLFPGYLLYFAPHVAQSWTVDRYTANFGGGVNR